MTNALQILNDGNRVNHRGGLRFARGLSSAGVQLLCWSVLVAASRVVAADFAPADLEFFEKRVRPVLVERCYKCHSATSEKLKGGLHLDSRAGLLKGGDTRTAVVPGNPEKSLLIEAVRYGNPDLEMPPKARLSEAQIADLVEWVRMGAPWPAESGVAPASASKKEFDLAKRKAEHWCWQPIRATQPPTVKDTAWPAQPTDRFLLSKLEQAGLKPAPPAEKYTLLRRVYFDLIGLPPPPEELERFLNDASPRAYERVVDRLLASPHFGERWGRHWLDLARYSETLGHEFDYPIHNAWRYRDYVIRGLNADLPYDQFLTEHVAGDLLDTPRRHPVDGFNESIIGTAFYWLGQRDHSPVDVRLHQAEVIDNQLDVLSKTFLGVTLSCARCHDHKFDAISTKDYYALHGVLGSSRYVQRSINAPEKLNADVTRLRALKQDIRAALGAVWIGEAERAQDYLAAAREVSGGAQAGGVAKNLQLNEDKLGRWIRALAEVEKSRSAAKSVSPPRTNDTMFADFQRQDFSGWFVEGEAFGHAPAPAGDFIVGDAKKPVSAIFHEPVAHSGALAARLQGALRSPTFTISNRFIHILAAGRESRLRVPIDNFTMIRDPIYGRLHRALNHDELKWISVDVEMWRGHRAYLEFTDISTPDPADDGHKSGFAPTGWLAVSRVVFSEQAEPPILREPFVMVGMTAALVRAAVRGWNAGQLDWLLRHGLLDCDPDSASVRRLSSLVEEYQRVAGELADPMRVPSLADGSGLDEAVFIRGNHKTPGDPVPRRFLEALGGSPDRAFQRGSGRLELARAMTDFSNPLTARVAVNRVWLHLFGRGLVPTPDDFGVLGQAPTHPELLDWLANWFRTEGNWQTKKLIKRLVTSRAYQMSSHPADAVAEEKDPANQLWHRMPVRRLEGEAMRDAMLALSGRLDQTMFGPPVPVHLTEFMDGRGRPGSSGPLDGAGRRSIYVEVRRNFVSPMMRAFDTPVPHTSIGRRTVSNVPAQSLILMNDPFVVGQAQLWARRVLADESAAPEQRVQNIYLAAFSRPPTAVELSEALSFLDEQGGRLGVPAASGRTNAEVWADFCHVMLNVKEFVFVR